MLARSAGDFLVGKQWFNILFECFSRHLGFGKHGELGRVKEGEEGGGEGGG